MAKLVGKIRQKVSPGTSLIKSGAFGMGFSDRVGFACPTRHYTITIFVLVMLLGIPFFISLETKITKSSSIHLN